MDDDEFANTINTKCHELHQECLMPCASLFTDYIVKMAKEMDQETANAAAGHMSNDLIFNLAVFLVTNFCPPDEEPRTMARDMIQNSLDAFSDEAYISMKYIKPN